jgi:hypothetical protein
MANILLEPPAFRKASWGMPCDFLGLTLPYLVRTFVVSALAGSVRQPPEGGTTNRQNSIAAIMAKRTAYQDKIIRRYYQNQDDIMLQKLGELVTDLYLAEGKAKQRLWDRVATALKNLKIPETQIQHLVQADNPTLVANLLKELLAKR